MAVLGLQAVAGKNALFDMQKWLQASRPLAQGNIAPPLLLGQALAYAAYGTFSVRLFLLIHLWGILDHLFIVFANDAADVEADVRNTTFNRFSGGSRVVPEGKLAPRDLFLASMLALAGMALVSVVLVFSELRMFMLVVTAFAALMLWAYSFPPVRLSYRGGGELLQGLGVGAVLPLVGFYVQSGTVSAFPWPALAASFVLGWAGNVVTALPDTPSDAKVEKRALPVRRGERFARHAVLLAVGAVAAAMPFLAPAGARTPVLLATALPIVTLALALRLADTADSGDHERCERFVALCGGSIFTVYAGWAAVLFLTAH